MTPRRLMALGAALLTVAFTLAACEERRDTSRRDGSTAVASSTAATKHEATAGPKTPPPAPGASAPPKTTVRPTTPEEQAARFPTATPMSVAKPRLVGGIPEGAVGPLLVYSRALGQVVIDGNDIPVREIVTYDIGRGQVVAAFDFSADPKAGAYSDVSLSGRQLFVQGGGGGSTPRLRWYALDGTLVHEAQAHPASFPGRAVPSPDGRLYAQDVEGGVVIVDVASGHVVNHFEGPVWPAGEPLSPVAWAEDGAWVVAQAINPHRASGLWMLMADGTERELAAGGEAAKWRVTADGRYAALLTGIACPNGGNQVGSFCEYTGTAFEVRDLRTNQAVARVDFGGLGRFMLRASDGERLLYSLHRPRPGHDLATAEAWRDLPTEWYELDLRTGVSTRINDNAALEAGRIAAWRVVGRCSDEVWPITLEAPFFFSGCEQITVDGTVVASGRELYLLGVIR